MCEGFFTADMTLGEVRQTFRKLLAECDNAFVRQTPALDADVIICHFGGFSRTYLLTHEDEQISFFLAEDLSLALDRRLSGLPVAYIINEKEFYGRPFYVDQNVLIPKPDTELLVELATADARRRMSEMRVGPSEQNLLAGDAGRLLRIADICTGSGCIAISLLLELCGGGAFTADDGLASSGPGDGSLVTAGCAPGDGSLVTEIAATDISDGALNVAKTNAGKLIPDRLLSHISFLQGDLCTPLDTLSETPDGGHPVIERLFDIIVSNPPYVPAAVTDELLADGRGEPRLALDGDTDTAIPREPGDGSLVPDLSTDGLAIIRRLGSQVFRHLAPGGSFFLETGEYNAEAAAAYLETVGFTDVRIHRDLSGQLRVTEAHRPF